MMMMMGSGSLQPGDSSGPPGDDSNQTDGGGGRAGDGGAAVGGVDGLDPLIWAVGRVRSNARARRQGKATAFRAQAKDLRPRLSAPQQLLVEACRARRGYQAGFTYRPFREGSGIHYLPNLTSEMALRSATVCRSTGCQMLVYVEQQ